MPLQIFSVFVIACVCLFHASFANLMNFPISNADYSWLITLTDRLLKFQTIIWTSNVKEKNHFPPEIVYFIHLIQIEYLIECIKIIVFIAYIRMLISIWYASSFCVRVECDHPCCLLKHMYSNTYMHVYKFTFQIRSICVAAGLRSVKEKNWLHYINIFNCSNNCSILHAEIHFIYKLKNISGHFFHDFFFFFGLLVFLFVLTFHVIFIKMLRHANNLMKPNVSTLFTKFCSILYFYSYIISIQHIRLINVQIDLNYMCNEFILIKSNLFIQCFFLYVEDLLTS